MGLTGCKNDTQQEKTLVIAEQFGLAYAPVQIMKAKGFLNDRLTNYNIQWVKLGNASAIRESIIAGELDVGFVGIPPFIIGYDHQTPWKIISGLSEAPLGLMSSDKKINSLKDIDQQTKIALPQPGSIQHILLQMAAKKEFNNPKKFDQQLVTMNHPDGMNALLATNEIRLHFTSPPYLFMEQENKALTLLLEGKEAFGGEFTFIVGVSNEAFFNNTEAYQAMNEAIERSISFIEDNPEETIEILSDYYDYDQSTLRDYLYHRGIQFNDEIKGLEQFIEFMYETQMIDHPYDVEKLQWETDHEN
jgi:NitT/TauT family transport system substrate-binding protein